MTGDAKRDEHLIGADFFDAANHKQINFVSSTIGKADENGNHELWGELTLRGVTKNLKLDVEFGGLMLDPWGNEKAGFTVTGKINRSDYGLVWNTPIEAGGLMVGDEIKITCDIQLINLGKSDLEMAVEDNELILNEL